MDCQKIFLLVCCCVAAGNAQLQCAYNGMDFSSLQGKSYLKHAVLVNVSTDYHLTICGVNPLRCNASEFNWPPNEAPDRKNFPMGALLEVYNWAADNGKYKSCKVLGQYEENMASWNKTEAGTSELILTGAPPDQCRIPGKTASTHIEFLCGVDESPDPSNITMYLGMNCIYEVKFPTSLACI